MNETKSFDRDSMQKLIDTFWNDITVKFISKDNIRSFLNEYFDTGFNTKSSKSMMIEKMKELLTPETIELFANNLKDFGLRKKDIVNFGLSQYRTNKAIKSGVIRIVAEKTTHIYEFGKKTFYLYNALDVLNLYADVYKNAA